ncbi:MAG: molybdenum cofactor guanylyltransferase [Bacteroidia bacterium]|nr:molybdenum cofactor guanylyltransferase [Bacteroidia bacterium]
MKRTEIVGVVNAGGQSLRMGHHKALIEWQGETLLERAVSHLQVFCERVIIISNNPEIRLAGIRTYPDMYPDTGPLGGIVTGLHEARGKGILVLPVDLPFVTLDFLGYLIKKIKPKVTATVPVEGSEIQPLCAYYSPRAIPALENMVKENQLKLTQAVRALNPDFIPISRESYFSYDSRLFFNVNTPEDLEKLIASEGET